MKTKIINFAIVSIIALGSNNSIATAETPAAWQLPLQISDQNTKVSFEVDTTWHVVYGNVHNATGTVTLNNPDDILSVESEIRIPTNDIETGWGARDDSLHEHMQTKKYPEIIFKNKSVNGQCTPSSAAQGPCGLELVGTLTICDVTKEITIPATIEKSGQSYIVKGQHSLKWAEYNVKDPSMLVATVEPVVMVKYEVNIPEASPKE